MKKSLTILLSIIFLSCAVIKFKPETGEFAYTRIGDQHIQGLTVTKSKEGVYSITLDNQQTEGFKVLTDLLEVLKMVAKQNSQGTLPSP